MFKYIFAGFIVFNLGLISASQVPESKLEGSPVCEVCTVVLTAAQNLLEQNKTADEVIQFIEKELCSRLGALSDTCSQYIEKYGPTVIYMLAQKIDPSIVCNHLGLCQTIAVEPHPVLKPISNSLNCTLCKLVFTQVQNMLKNNASQEELLKLIENKLCNATGALSTECKTLIETFGPTILNYLAKGVDPEKLCELIGMCSAKSRKLQSFKEAVESIRFNKMGAQLEKAAPVPIAGNPEYCTMCQYAVQFILLEIKKNSTEAAIVNALEEVCKLAPASSQKQCDDLIGTYGIYLVQLVIQLGDPLKVCQTIKLC